MGNMVRSFAEGTSFQRLLSREELPEVPPSTSEEQYEPVPPMSIWRSYYNIDRMRRESGFLMNEDEAQEAIDFYTSNGRFSTKLLLYKDIALALKNYRYSEASTMPARALDRLMFATLMKGVEYKMPTEVAWAIVNYKNENGKLPDWTNAARLLYRKKRPTRYVGMDRLSPLADFTHIPTVKGRAIGSQIQLPHYYLEKSRRKYQIPMTSRR